MDDNKIEKAKILLVDDEPNVLRMVGYVLHTEGFEVAVAQSGAQALAAIQKAAPDLVILDVMMPDMSGLEVCAQLRKKQSTVKLPVIMLSALSEIPDKVKAFEAGADEYIVKPIAPEELVARIKALLLRYRQVQSNSGKTSAKVFGFVGSKGGVGTTSVALNIASVYAMQQKKVLAVEVRDNFGSFSPQLNLAQHPGLMSLLKAELKEIGEREVNKYFINLPSGLSLLVGPQKLSDYEDIDPRQLEAIIRSVATMFDFVVLDCSCPSSPPIQAALQYSDYILLIVEPELCSLASGAIALEQIKSWEGTPGNLGVIVVNRSQFAQSVKLDQIKARLGQEIIGVIPNAADNFIAAQNAGVPVVTYRLNSDIARAFNEVAKKLSELVAVS